MPDESALLNSILAALPSEDYERLAGHLEPIELTHGQIIHQTGSPIKHVYFPSRSTISLVSQTAEGDSIEVGVIGFEGVLGISVVLGVDESPHDAIAQINNGASRIDTRLLIDEFKKGGALHDRLLRYTRGLLLQTSQLAVCNRLHTVSERLARWLLMTYDRCVCEDLPLTQEFLSLMLGARRAGVTEAAGALQELGYIKYRRGHIQINDRVGLEESACACYRIVKAEFDLLT